jgi:hypothetical protein
VSNEVVASYGWHTVKCPGCPSCAEKDQELVRLRGIRDALTKYGMGEEIPIDHPVRVMMDGWANTKDQRIAELGSATRRVASALQDAKAQWGDEYLWGKLIDDEVLKEPIILALRRE